MEFVEGGSLAQKLAGTPQPAREAAELVATLAGQPLYAASGFAAIEHFEIPLGGALSMPVVRMSKRIVAS